MNRLYTIAAFLIILVLSSASVQAQEVVPAKEPATSPLQMTKMLFDNGTYVKITYHAPRRKDREVYGGLVPFGRRWRLGANEATEITTTGPLSFAGTRMNAGTYSLHAIPGESEWTIMVNSSLGDWGTRYDESKDVFRVQAPASQIDAIHEALSINLEKTEGGAAMVITWEQTQVTVPITVR